MSAEPPDPGARIPPRPGAGRRRRSAPRDPELPLGTLPNPITVPPAPDLAPYAAPDPAPSRARVAPEYGPPVDLFTPRPVPPPPPPPPPVPEPPPPIPVQRVSPDGLFAGGSRPDAYLYLVADRAEAERLLRCGLSPDPEQPPLLLERRGVPAVLSALEEDGTGTGATVVLRLRRFAVEELVEDEPDRRGAGAAFLLTGRPGRGP